MTSLFRVLCFVACSTLVPVCLAQTPDALATKPADTPIHLVVFSDFQCPISAVEFQALERLSAAYGSRLQLVWKQSPLPAHPAATIAHRAELAAARQAQGSAMATLLFANQSHQSEGEILSYAQHLHLDLARFRRDLHSPEIAAQLEADRVESQAMGIVSTPTLYLDGQRLVGLQSEATLKRLIDEPAATNVASGTEEVAPRVDASLMRELAQTHTVRGAQDAPVTLVEFTDFQCPFCAASVDPLRKLLETRGQQVRIVYRAFPLDFHPQANLAAEAAFAAGAQGRFWEMHDLLFANQRALSREDLDRYATQLGLNMPVFREALETHRFAADVAEDRALGAKAGVTGTPAFFLNGEVLEGARSLSEMLAWVDARGSNSDNAAQTAAPERRIPDLLVAGNTKSATVKLTWFTDVRSPSAADQAKLVQDLLTRSKGKLEVVYRPYPSANRPDANLAAAALIAAQKHGKFWELYKALATRRDVLDRDKLAVVAKSLSLDPAALLSSEDSDGAELTAQIEDASRRGILGSPVMFINGTRIDGLQRQAFYTSILDRELAGAPNLAQR